MSENEVGIYVVRAQCGYVWKDVSDTPEGVDTLRCPVCQHGTSVRSATLENAREHSAKIVGRSDT